MLRVRRSGDARVAVQQRARVERGEQPLVRVDDEAVGVLDAGEQVADARRRERGAAVRTVDVHPGAELRRRIGGSRAGRRRRRRSWCPTSRRSRRSDHGRRRRAHRSPYGVPPRSAVHGHRRERARRRRPSLAPPARPTSARRPTRSSIRGCGRGRRRQRRRHCQRAAISALRFPAVPPLTNTPPAGAGQPGEVGDPTQRLVLGEDRPATFQPRAGVDARRADDEVEQDRRPRSERRGRTTGTADGRPRCTPDRARPRRRRSASSPPSPSGVIVLADQLVGVRRACVERPAVADRAASVRRRSARSPRRAPRSIVVVCDASQGAAHVARRRRRVSRRVRGVRCPRCASRPSRYSDLADDPRGDRTAHDHQRPGTAAARPTMITAPAMRSG